MARLLRAGPAAHTPACGRARPGDGGSRLRPRTAPPEFTARQRLRIELCCSEQTTASAGEEEEEEEEGGMKRRGGSRGPRRGAGRSEAAADSETRRYGSIAADISRLPPSAGPGSRRRDVPRRRARLPWLPAGPGAPVPSAPRPRRSPPAPLAAAPAAGGGAGRGHSESSKNALLSQCQSPVCTVHGPSSPRAGM
ncbi:E3 ubiquitin-protein ligase TRIM33-like [Motacilla alba alba]|uniref:E3 ubiquitin-protein ligase TRIM33-like n=1 Tax=Motacilla alba alba TaxID=1094192 RepID=UPI0018D52BF8|nr:E3 ubiquitin-protein ligase TRIM33-like [Motacilla alba alba]